jgi:hypothetical protein
MGKAHAVICLTSYNRLDCARINQELIKRNYKRQYPIVHASSSPTYAAYLEDRYVRSTPKPLHQGAMDLLQQAVRTAVSDFNPRYIVHVEADTWLMDEQVLQRYLAKMDANPFKLLCTCEWSNPSRANPSPPARSMIRRARSFLRRCLKGDTFADFGTQFFIARTHPRLIASILNRVPNADKKAEVQLYEAFTSVFGLNRVLRMVEREPVHPAKRYICEELSLYCQHWPSRGTAMDPRDPGDPLYVSNDMIGKKETLLKYPNMNRGEHIQKLLRAQSYDYYNPGAIRY